MFDYVQPVFDWYMENLNYLTITVLMAVESSFIPFPSEIIIPPAAWKAAEGDLNIYLVVLFSTLGALIGAYVNYFLALSLGRPLVYAFAKTKMAKLLMISPEKVEQAEAYFVKNGSISTLIGRLIPGIRQLISVPAGLAKMRLLPFTLYTFLGAAVWNVILALLGYYLGNNKEVLKLYYHELSIGLLVLGVLFVAYLVWKACRKK